jgi:putative hydrolase of the HAD superfamily
VDTLAYRFRLAVVNNTHQADLLPAHLSAMGIAHRFDTFVTSVEVGWRKPRPAIYATALRRFHIAVRPGRWPRERIRVPRSMMTRAI